LTFRDFTGYNSGSSRFHRDFLGLISLKPTQKLTASGFLGTDARFGGFIPTKSGNMIKLNFNLAKYRLDVSVVKRRETSSDKPLLPNFSDLKNTRSGNKVSRYFRHVFEHKNIRKILGTNLALIMVASSFLPSHAGLDIQAEENIVNEINTPPLTTQRGIQYPVETVKITQGFTFFHPGIDLDGLSGDPIRPIMVGVVKAIQESKYAYGNAIIINHGNEITSLYAHLSKILVQEGQEVTLNTIIGKMGSSGRAFGDHLHLEVRDHERPINPLSILLLPKI
jgi:murein DD-endopeptidase MepM/ murein hydrolase activator NlpD